MRSENAAKTECQKSAYFSRLLQQLAPVKRTLDYGCGKLRYLHEISSMSDELYVTDSDVQLSRTQIINGVYTSIIEAVEDRNHVHLIHLRDFNQMPEYFDRVVLANVLQVVPIIALRAIILRRIFRSLRPGGELILVVQYRNSDFNRMMKMPNARLYLDGMVIKHIRGTSFYAFIQPAKLKEIVTSQGFEIVQNQLNEGSCYIIARKPNER